MSTLQDYYDFYVDGQQPFSSTIYLGQSFTAATSYNIISVALLLYRTVGSTPGTITVSINTTSGSLPYNALPTTTVLCSGTYNGNTITDDSNGIWYEITFGTGTYLTASTIYAIVISATSTGGYWRYDTNSAPPPTGSGYTVGNYCYSINSGSTWNIMASERDCMFKTYSPTVVYLDVSGTIAGNGTLSGSLDKAIVLPAGGFIRGLSELSGMLEIFQQNIYPEERPGIYNPDKIWNEETKTWVTAGSRGGDRYKDHIITVGRNDDGDGVIYYV